MNSTGHGQQKSIIQKSKDMLGRSQTQKEIRLNHVSDVLKPHLWVGYQKVCQSMPIRQALHLQINRIYLTYCEDISAGILDRLKCPGFPWPGVTVSQASLSPTAFLCLKMPQPWAEAPTPRIHDPLIWVRKVLLWSASVKYLCFSRFNYDSFLKHRWGFKMVCSQNLPLSFLLPQFVVHLDLKQISCKIRDDYGNETRFVQIHGMMNAYLSPTIFWEYTIRWRGGVQRVKEAREGRLHVPPHAGIFNTCQVVWHLNLAIFLGFHPSWRICPATFVLWKLTTILLAGTQSRCP